MLLAGVGLRKFKLLGLALTGNSDDEKSALGERKRGLNRIGKTGANTLAHHKTVNDDLDRVADIFIKLYFFIEIIEASVNSDAGVARALRVGKHLFVHTFFCANNGRKHHKSLSVGEGFDLFYDLINRLTADLLAADRAMRNSDACVKQTEIVVNFSDRTNG